MALQVIPRVLNPDILNKYAAPQNGGPHLAAEGNCKAGPDAVLCSITEWAMILHQVIHETY